MRILMVNHEFTFSGASTFFHRLARHLLGQGHSLAVLPINPADGPIRQRYVEAGIPVVSRAAAADFDVALCNTICAAPAVVQLGPNLPVVWFVNEAEVALDLIKRNPGWAVAFRQAASIILNMPFQAEVLASFLYDLPPDRVRPVAQGVDVAEAPIARDRVPQKVRALRLVQVGTIEPRKRPGDVIRAVARSGLDLECTICGTFFEMDPEARAIAAADPVRFRVLSGLPDDEVLAWVASADIFCLASGSETQALVAYEAGQLARPLILSDLACYRSIFRHGREALLYPAGNIAMLVGSLRMLAWDAELRRELGEAARTVARRYTNRRFFDEIDLVLRQVMAGRI